MAINALSSILFQGLNPTTKNGVGQGIPVSQKPSPTTVAQNAALSPFDSFESSFQIGARLVISQPYFGQKTNDSNQDSAAQNKATAPDKTDVESDANELSREEQAEVSQLTTRDREVRAHEQAHIAAGGNLVRGGASYEYQTGPDGKRYAVGGEVEIDTSPVRDDPKATISKAEHIKRAALAPADPSAQDYKVASQATSMASDAAMELARKKYEEAGGRNPQDTLPISIANITA